MNRVFVSLLMLAATLFAPATDAQPIPGLRPAFAGRPPASTQQEYTINIGGLTRTYQLYVPSAYQQAAPLVFLFHGAGGNATQIVNLTGFQAIAEREGFILAAPQGWANTWNAGSGQDQGPAEEYNIDDLGFVQAMLAKIKGDYSIDGSRVYLTGMSKGGMLTYHLACNMAADIAAIAVVSGAMTAATCAPVSPVALLHIHGSSDDVVPLEGGVGVQPGVVYPPAQQAIDLWRSNNGCLATPVQRQINQPSMFCTIYGGCISDVSLCVIQNGEHTWPSWAAGSGWDFFERHSK